MENKTYGSKKRVLLIALSVVAVLTIVFLVWDLFIQRIFGNPFRPEQEFKGLSCFDSQEYKNFEKGELFVETFSSYEFSNQCRVTDFYYINNQHQDSLYYGICPDIYGMTLDAGEYYDEVKSYIQQIGTDEGSYLVPSLDGKHVIFYSMPSYAEDAEDLYVFAVGQDIPFLRFILITEYREEDCENPRYIVSTHSRMDWD